MPEAGVCPAVPGTPPPGLVRAVSPRKPDATSVTASVARCVRVEGAWRGRRAIGGGLAKSSRNWASEADLCGSLAAACHVADTVFMPQSYGGNMCSLAR